VNWVGGGIYYCPPIGNAGPPIGTPGTGAGKGGGTGLNP